MIKFRTIRKAIVMAYRYYKWECGRLDGNRNSVNLESLANSYYVWGYRYGEEQINSTLRHSFNTPPFGVIPENIRVAK
jgi:hypothetical protein